MPSRAIEIKNHTTHKHTARKAAQNSPSNVCFFSTMQFSKLHCMLSIELLSVYILYVCLVLEIYIHSLNFFHRKVNDDDDVHICSDANDKFFISMIL